MERRKRNLLVVLIGIVIVVAMVSSFGLGLFAPDTAKIVLPTPEVSQQPGGEPGEQSGLVLVDVTPETTMSINSAVIFCCLNLLYSNCKFFNNLIALSFAICIDKIREACS